MRPKLKQKINSLLSGGVVYKIKKTGVNGSVQKTPLISRNFTRCSS
jgi:hypothetical protein